MEVGMPCCVDRSAKMLWADHEIEYVDEQHGRDCWGIGLQKHRIEHRGDFQLAGLARGTGVPLMQ